MPYEIEWRFLVLRMTSLPKVPTRPMVQAYLATSPSVRVRIEGDKAELTIKIPPTESVRIEKGAGPLERREFNYPIPIDEARQLVESCDNRIEKTRHVFPDGLEVDVFEGALEGLVLAEMEVERSAPAPHPPEGWEWVDVSHDKRWSNASLATIGLPDGFHPTVRE